MDTFTLSRPKKNIARDFADGCLVAELIQKYHPHLVQIHNYSSVNNRKTKLANWKLLETKVLNKIGLKLPPVLVEQVIDAQYMAIEKLLLVLKTVLETTDVPKPKIRALKTTSSYNGRDADSADEEDVVVDSRKFRNFQPPEVNKDDIILELKESVEILEKKINKLNQMLKIKDDKIRILEEKLFQFGMN